MVPRDLDDLAAFVVVARERSFTGAAAKLGLTQSALSQTIRKLEERLGLRLLARTTRSVSPTEAGERLLRSVAPKLEEIERELAGLQDLRERPSGTIRITSNNHAAETILWPAIERLMPMHPGIRFELDIQLGLIDIVAERFDAGVRLGEQVERDMIAVRIGPDMRMAVVGAPSYFATRPLPSTPEDLLSHDCITIRQVTSGGIRPWEFERNGHELNARVEGRLVFNDTRLRMIAVLAGQGLCYLPETHVQDHIAQGRLVRVLEEWCPFFPGYHLYYPNRRLASAAFEIFVEAVRYRG